MEPFPIYLDQEESIMGELFHEIFKKLKLILSNNFEIDDEEIDQAAQDFEIYLQNLVYL